MYIPYAPKRYNPSRLIDSGNLALWLDATDESTITHDSGSVSQWNDKSGNGNHAVQGTSSKQPTLTSNAINGLPIIKGDNSDDVMTGNFAYDCADEFHVFLVGSEISGGDCIFDIKGTNSRIVNTNGTVGRDTSGGFGTSTPTAYVNASPFLVYASHLNSKVATNDEFEMYSDGNTTQETSYPSTVSLGAFTSETFDNYYILDDNSGGNAWDGGLGEYIVIRGTLSTANRQKIEGYLAHKWGLTANLPAGHPYKTFSPTV